MSISFMSLGNTDSKVESSGLMINIRVEDIDYEYSILRDKVTIVTDIANHPWGDRSFQIKNSLGNILYIYTPLHLLLMNIKMQLNKKTMKYQSLTPNIGVKM